MCWEYICGIVHGGRDALISLIFLSNNHHSIWPTILFLPTITTEEENEDAHDDDHVPEPSRIFTDHELSSLVDPVLATEDTNQDGFIDYPEFIAASNKNKKNQSQ